MKGGQKELNDRDLIVGVLGLGYAGPPPAREFALEGIKAVGFEIGVREVIKAAAADHRGAGRIVKA